MAKPIIEVPGIGTATAAILVENGISSAEDLAAQTVVQLASIKTFSEIRAARVINAAKALLAEETLPQVERMNTPAGETATKKKSPEKVAKKKTKDKVKDQKKDQPNENDDTKKAKKATKEKKKKKSDKADKKTKKAEKDKKGKKEAKKAKKK